MSAAGRTLAQRLLPLLCIVAIVVAGSFVAIKLVRGGAVDTDILSLLPAGQEDPTLAAALHRLNDVASRRVVLMLQGSTPRDRTAAAGDLSDNLVKAGSFRPSTEEGAQAWGWLFAHRTTLLCPDDEARLQRGQGGALAQEALMRWYSPIGISNSDLLKSDPMLLTPRLASCFLGQLGKAPGQDLVVVSGTITDSVFDTRTQDRLEAVLQQWKTRWPSIKIYRAGAIFHAEHAAASARFQMSMISVATGVLILLIYILVFRSVRPPLLAILLIASCLAMGLAATFIFYERIHVMVIVFASALIGMVVDYSTYYLITGVARPADSAEMRRGSIVKPLTLGMATSVAAFLALLASPIPAFRQIGILGSLGLFAAWLLALYLLPILDTHRRKRAPFAEKAKEAANWLLAWRARPAIGAVLVAAASVIAIIAIAQDNVLDDVRRFQAPAPALAAEESQIRASTGFVAPSVFILVTGNSDEEERQNEEAVLARIYSNDAHGNIVVLAATWFDPSDEAAVKQGALLRTQLLDDHLQPLLAQLNVAQEKPYASVQPQSSAPLPEFVRTLRGRAGPTFWSIVPLDIAASAIPPTLAPDGPNSTLVDPATAYSALLGSYRWNASIGLVVGTVITGLALIAAYRRLAALWILLPTALAMVTAPSLLAIFGMPYSFFSAMGLFLVVGAGVDYSIFQWEHRDARAPWTRLGILLAALMTCTSLGLLGLSSIYPVASFGITVALGIFLSLIMSPLVTLGFGTSPGAKE